MRMSSGAATAPPAPGAAVRLALLYSRSAVRLALLFDRSRTQPAT
ncbi:hypothetical protein [Salinifilum aidingensis]